ncbi:MAG TPA: hypothetical protein VM509_09595 [Planctomycetota bacterium]|nr:hypothetical protein [Planctomycetota bacterium]
MQIRLSRRVLVHLCVLVCGFLMLACEAPAGGSASAAPSNASATWQDKTVYTRVGMKVEAAKKGGGWHMYSTNHVGLPKHIPAGSKFTAREQGRSQIELVGEDGSVIHVEFVARHHPDMNFASWLERQLSTTPVELPASLDEKERAAIQAGRWEVGMSRAALFLAIGYPPTALTPSPNDALLKYEVKKFDNIVFDIDAQDHVASIRD